MNEVNKSIANIASIVVVNWQVKKVKFDFEVFVKLFQKKILSIFIGNIADHESSTPICFDLYNEKQTFSG